MTKEKRIKEIIELAQELLLQPKYQELELEDVLEEMGVLDEVVEYIMEGGDIMKYQLK